MKIKVIADRLISPCVLSFLLVGRFARLYNPAANFVLNKLGVFQGQPNAAPGFSVWGLDEGLMTLLSITLKTFKHSLLNPEETAAKMGDRSEHSDWFSCTSCILNLPLKAPGRYP